MVLMSPLAPSAIAEIAREMLWALDSHAQVSPISERRPGFDLATAYATAARIEQMRSARGERAVGRKLGFTNRNIWDEYKVYSPIWSYMYDTTVRAVDPAGADFDLARVVEPRIEPEITLSFKRAPAPGMDEAALLDCLDWVAHGFEIVQTLFPGWRFAAADTVAAFGLHGMLLLGPKHAITPDNKQAWSQRLSSFSLVLMRNGDKVDHGHASNVLGGPLTAVKNVVDVLARDPYNRPLEAGEFVTTGTVTRAFPIARGECWQTSIEGAPFEGLKVTFT